MVGVAIHNPVMYARTSYSLCVHKSMHMRTCTDIHTYETLFVMPVHACPAFILTLAVRVAYVCIMLGRVRGTEALARTAAVWHMLRTAWRDASDKGITSALATTVRGPQMLIHAIIV